MLTAQELNALRIQNAIDQIRSRGLEPIRQGHYYPASHCRKCGMAMVLGGIAAGGFGGNRLEDPTFTICFHCWQNEGHGLVEPTRNNAGDEEEQLDELQRWRRRKESSQMSEAIPVDVQEKLLMFADHLPADKWAAFIQTVSRETIKAVKDHPRALIYGALGWVLGEILDNLLSFKIPFKDTVIALTADRASDIGAAAGVIKGFIDDRKTIAERDQMSRVVAKGLKEAMG